MKKSPLIDKLLRIVSTRLASFWTEDRSPKRQKRAVEREKDWRTTEISQKRSHLVLGGARFSIFHLFSSRGIFAVL